MRLRVSIRDWAWLTNHFPQPQFSLKRLFASLTLIAIGCAMFVWGGQLGAIRQLEYAPWLMVICIVGGLCLVGAGIGNIFKHSGRGALIGIELFIVVALILVVWSTIRISS